MYLNAVTDKKCYKTRINVKHRNTDTSRGKASLLKHEIQTYYPMVVNVACFVIKLELLCHDENPRA